MTENEFSIYREKGLSDNLARVLYNRGIRDKKSLTEYIEPEKCVYDPFMFKGMKDAAELITKHIKAGNNIIIFGDYDVDGVTATCIMYDCITSLGGKVKRAIPDRNKDGYGINMEFARNIVKGGFKLVITVDTGITAVEETAFLRSNNIDVIVTDHHEPGDTLPTASVIIDAKVSNETYPYKELCGAAVAYKVAYALMGKESAGKYIQMAALATVADAVPLLGENRYIVKEGLEKMNSEPDRWMKSIKQIAVKTSQITASSLAFAVAPVINACGRIAHAKEAVDFFCEQEEGESLRLAVKMSKYNEIRKETENAALNELKPDLSHKIILVSGKWKHGILGLIAARLVERYRRPAIVFSYDSEKGLLTGSGRSIGNVDMFSVLSSVKNLTVKFGGHSQALGVTIKDTDAKAFANAVYAVFDSMDISSKKNISIDLEVNNGDYIAYTIPDLFLMEPIGNSNTAPVVKISNVEFSRFSAFNNGTSSYSVWNKKTNEQFMAFKKEPPSSVGVPHDIVLSVPSDGRPIILDIAESAVPEEDIRAYKVPDENFGSRSIPVSLSALGVSDRKIPQFNNAGIFNSEDLINYFPIRYADYRKTILASELTTNVDCAIIGTVKSVRSNTGANNKAVTSCTCTDSNGELFTARWFGQSFVAKMLTPGAVYIFCGTGYVGMQGYPSVNVKYFDRNIAKLKTFLPIYKKITGMSYDYLTSAIDSALARQPLNDYLEKSVVEDFNMIDYIQSIRSLHRPRSEEEIKIARKRRIFDALFKFNLILKNNVMNITSKNEFPIKSTNSYKSFISLLPYELTNGQKEAVESLLNEMRDSPTPVNALVQGDVGCGKTVVAYILAAAAVENGYQVCITAPTEILARQHYDGLMEYAEQLGIKTAFLSGTTKAKERKTTLSGIASGDINVLIGTHAVFQKDVTFSKLGLAIIDEQHKFGVEQRNRFVEQDIVPHLITMSATPIPRTLAMATFGDTIKVYNIKEKPFGRKPVKTIKMDSETDMCDFILEQIHQGHQAYIVCPRIDDNDKNVQSVESTVQSVSAYFSKYPDIHISDISGRMKQQDINDEIMKFKNNETQILISTTIIEVGVNIPNATVIALNSSDKFGLAQAHQLRGRVGRGSAQSYCLLRPDNPADEKASILCENGDGFEIAKADLALRGTGDFIGTSQSGNNKDVMLMLSEPDMYNRIAALNDEIIKDPKRLELYKFLLN